MVSALGLALVLACVPKGARAVADTAVADGEPRITGLSHECSAEEGLWTFQAATDAWSGGMRLWWARSVTEWERHTGYSVGASADGRADLLEIELLVVADWRDAREGSSTRFACAEEEALDFRVAVYSRDGSVITDCRSFGLGGLLDQIEDVPACED